MRQETGSNTHLTNDKVSIQLRLGGHSFSAAELERLAAADGIVTVLVNSPKVTLVPRAEFDTSLAEHYLAICGKAPNEQECTLFSDTEADIIAVMAVDRAEANTIADILGPRARFTTPLLYDSHCDENCTVATLLDDVLYLRHYNNGLRYAEAIAVSCEADTLYYIIEGRNHCAAEEQTPLYMHADKGCYKLLKRYIRRVICE